MTDFSCETLPGPPIGEITRMVERRNRGLTLMEQAIDLIVEAQRLLPQYTLESELSNRFISALPEYPSRVKTSIKTAIDKKCWQELLDKSKLGVVMTASQESDVRELLNKDVPELTHDVALGTFSALFERRGDTFKQGFVELFKSLSGNYKSNDAFKIGSRLIISCSSKRHFVDMAKYLMLLDGEDPTTIPYELRPENAVRDAVNRGQSEISFPWFDVRVFKCGNWHVWLKKRPDLTDKVNEIIAEYYGETVPDRR